MATQQQTDVEVGMGADRLLADAALGFRRWLPGRSGSQLVGRLARRPDSVARHGRGLAVELARVAAGRSAVAPARSDRRFTDPAWQDNPLLSRLMRAYLATGRTADD